MNLLAVDTTSRSGSVAFLQENELVGFLGFSIAPGHAETLLPAIDHLLRELGRKLADVDGYAVATGPGSFTGLRIGISTVEGLAYATDKPVAGVSSLDATAHRYRFRPGLVAAFLDARRGEVFGALYRSNGNDLSSVLDPVCEAPGEFIRRLPSEPVLVAGTGIASYGELLQESMRHGLQLADTSFFIAEEVGRIGRVLHQEGRTVPLGRIEAVYLRPSDAEKPPAGAQRL